MTKTNRGVDTNRIPLSTEIAQETLRLDAAGMAASKVVADYPINEDLRISKQDLFDPLIEAMAEEGWAFGGSGFFSAVFVKGGLALKLGFKVSDTGAMYAAWCRANRQLAGVPEVYSLSRFARCYAVLTRRYDRIDGTWLDETHAEYIPELAYEHSEICLAINTAGPVASQRFDTVLTASAVRQFFEGIVSFDMHCDNLMMDHRGDLVITDPISHGPCSSAGYYSYTQTREGDSRYYD